MTTTPTRDEAVRKACHVLRQWAAFFNDDSARQSAKEIIDLLAAAPAPASGGVDAVAVKALEWREIQTHSGVALSADHGDWNRRIYLRRASFRGGQAWIDRKKAEAQSEFDSYIRSALSPAATPVSEAGGELPVIPDDDADFTPDLARKIIAGYQRLLLAKPASSSSSPAAQDYHQGNGERE